MMNVKIPSRDTLLATFLYGLAGFILAAIIGVFFFESFYVFFAKGFGLEDKSEVLKYLGITFSGALLALQQIYFYRRVKAMEQNTESQTQSVNQERFKDAIAHLSNEKESVRLGGIYTLAHLGRDQSEKYLTTIIEIIAAHLRTTTQTSEYQKKYATQPSNEVQSALDLLFRKREDSLHKKGSDRIIDLSQSFFKGALLTEGFLSKVNFQQTQLQKADLSDALIQRANLSDAQLQEADLRLAQLQEAYLNNAQLQRADLWKAQLQGAYLNHAQLQGAALGSAQLQRADLWKAQLQGAFLIDAQLQGADLSNAQLQGAALSIARLQGANLSSAQLQGANLSSARLQGALLIDAQVQGADLNHAQLQGAYLYRAEFQDASFQATQLGGVVATEDDSLVFKNFKKRIKAHSGNKGDFSTVAFSGGITKKQAEEQEKHLKKVIEECPRYLDENKAKQFTKEMEEVIATYHQHSGKEAVHDLPESASNKPYTQEQAEWWIAEYKEAMKDVEGKQNS